MKPISIISLFDKSFLYKKLTLERIESILHDLLLIILVKEQGTNDLLNDTLKKVSQKELSIWLHFLTELKQELKDFEPTQEFKLKYSQIPEKFLFDKQWKLQVIIDHNNKKDIIINASHKNN